jgi:adenylate kinase family enzyme
VTIPSNPFSTRFIQPGALSYEFFGRTTANALAERVLSLPSKRAMIVGPHGSGKSTLVQSLLEPISLIAPAVRIHSLRFSSAKNTNQLLLRERKGWANGSIVLLDGYEQIPFWTRMLVERSVRRKSATLLVTMHKPRPGFELLWQTRTDGKTAEWVIGQLLPENQRGETITRLLRSPDWTESRLRNGENLRESLFDMYDWWQKDANRT